MASHGQVQPAVQASGLPALAQYMLPLMLRNMASDGFVFTDPANPQMFSAPGCIIASPSYPGDLSMLTQNYVYNWTRDAAIAAIEIAQANLPVLPGAGSGPLDDYVSFAALCQRSAQAPGAPGPSTACFTIEGQPRDGWSLQNDGPALRVLALLQAYGQLGPDAQDTARTVMEGDLAFVAGSYQNPGTNLWEEVRGQSFFTRAVQLECLTQAQAQAQVGAGAVPLTLPAGTGDAVSGLTAALATHWNGRHYVSVLEAQNPRTDYDPNIDIVLASLYGAIEVTDPQLLATAALLRQQWSDPAATATCYPVNQADAARDLGPLLGRYPADPYDGDLDNTGQDHPWALSTAHFAQLYYEVAASIGPTGVIPASPLAASFFGQAGVSQAGAAADAVQGLVGAGDRMLQALVYHSDHLELSEQFDESTGYEKSVRNLTWSYAAFLAAVRARARVSQG